MVNVPLLSKLAADAVGWLDFNLDSNSICQPSTHHSLPLSSVSATSFSPYFHLRCSRSKEQELHEKILNMTPRKGREATLRQPMPHCKGLPTNKIWNVISALHSSKGRWPCHYTTPWTLDLDGYTHIKHCLGIYLWTTSALDELSVWIVGGATAPSHTLYRGRLDAVPHITLQNGSRSRHRRKGRQKTTGGRAGNRGHDGP